MKVEYKKKNAIEALVKLADGLEGKSETGKIRDVIDWIELAFSSGVGRKKVLDTLGESLGIKMNFGTFETTLYRIRKESKQKGNQINNYSAPITTEKNNKLVPYSHNETRNTDLVEATSASESMDIHSMNENEDDWGQEISELELMKKLREPPNVAGYYEIEGK